MISSYLWEAGSLSLWMDVFVKSLSIKTRLLSRPASPDHRVDFWGSGGGLFLEGLPCTLDWLWSHDLPVSATWVGTKGVSPMANPVLFVTPVLGLWQLVLSIVQHWGSAVSFPSCCVQKQANIPAVLLQTTAHTIHSHNRSCFKPRPKKCQQPWRNML